MFSDTCEIKDCGKPAKNIASLPHTGIIDMCGDCYRELYEV